jgi:hypothetical protein
LRLELTLHHLQVIFREEEVVESVVDLGIAERIGDRDLFQSIAEFIIAFLRGLLVAASAVLRIVLAGF